MFNISFSHAAACLQKEILCCSKLIEISAACARTDSPTKKEIRGIAGRSFFESPRFNDIGKRIYQLAGCPQTDTDQLKWGRRHVFDDLSRLQQAIAELVLERFQQITPNKQLEKFVQENTQRLPEICKPYTQNDAPNLLRGIKQYFLSLHRESYTDRDLVNDLRNQLKKNGCCDSLWMEMHRERLAGIVKLDLNNIGIRNDVLIELSDYFPNLQVLFLNGNQLIELPKNFGASWPNLQELNLGNNQLEELPENFGASWPNLEILTLGFNQLTHLPENFGSNWQRLAHLHLLSNRLTHLPENFGSTWQDLRELCLSRGCYSLGRSGLGACKNPLVQLPENFGSSWGNLQQLYLSGSQLAHLPNHFGSFWQNLQILDLGENRLVRLPENFGSFWQNLQKLGLNRNQLTYLDENFGCTWQDLRELYLDTNRLPYLPENFGSMWRRLQVLCLGQFLEFSTQVVNSFAQLPENFGSSWRDLKTLYLANSRLTHLPDNFGSSWKNLKELYLQKNSLIQFPGNFGSSWRNLKRLNIHTNYLIQLPENFGSSWRNLEKLHLNQNQLTQLQEGFGSLWPTVSSIVLNGNPLTSLPLSITSLPVSCRIELQECRLSQQILSRLRAITQTSGYAGPRFSYSLEGMEERRENPIVVTSDMVDKKLTDLFTICQQAPRQYPGLVAQEDARKMLFQWLDRLSYTADYKKGGDLQKGFAQKILSYLDLAEREPKFRDAFLAGIAGAAETCGDRVTLSILHIGLAYRLEQMDLCDLPGLANLFLRGTWALSLLEEEARNKIPALPFYDEIEVYLGYPIKLKKELDLPIDAEEMLYFRSSALKRSDLDQAKRKVLAKLCDKPASYRFLLKQEKWMEALEARYPSEYANIQETRNERYEEDGDSYHEEIQRDYEQAMMALTAKALSDDANDDAALQRNPKRRRISDPAPGA